jgi:hypothetical protein
VSLDYVPDSHGHIGGHEAKPTTITTVPDAKIEITAAILAKIRAKVERMVKARKWITRSCRLENEVGRRFNGGELPTNV